MVNDYEREMKGAPISEEEREEKVLKMK